MTQRRVENTRVHFWTVSPGWVNVKNVFDGWNQVFLSVKFALFQIFAEGYALEISLT